MNQVLLRPDVNIESVIWNGGTYTPLLQLSLGLTRSDTVECTDPATLLAYEMLGLKVSLLELISKLLSMLISSQLLRITRGSKGEYSAAEDTEEGSKVLSRLS